MIIAHDEECLGEEGCSECDVTAHELVPTPFYLTVCAVCSVSVCTFCAVRLPRSPDGWNNYACSACARNGVH